MIISQPSPNYNERRNNAKIDTIVIHYTGMLTAKDALDRMCDKNAEVSSHYMIDEDGRIFQLVDEEKRAWHAGVSFWRGRTDINSCSIGIELVNKGHEFGYHPFAKRQITSLINLCKEIISRYKIPAYNIIGHSDIAPSRKTDPGELFDWQKLNKQGIGIWAEKKEHKKQPSFDNASNLLNKIGYDINDIDAAVIAFKRHFMPWKELNNIVDDETIFRIYQISCLI